MRSRLGGKEIDAVRRVARARFEALKPTSMGHRRVLCARCSFLAPNSFAVKTLAYATTDIKRRGETAHIYIYAVMQVDICRYIYSHICRYAVAEIDDTSYMYVNIGSAERPQDSFI